MDFNHPTQHSIENLVKTELALKQNPIPPTQSLFLASVLSSHAHPATPRLIAAIRKAVRHSEVLQHIDLLERCFDNLRKYYRYEDLPAQARRAFYKRSGSIFMRKATGPTKLLVIFATMFNNFHISIAALAHLLRDLDCSLLILKDSSLLNYHRGVLGVADSLPGIAPAIAQLAERENIRQVYMTGFSSNGYAALLTSLSTQCDGYLGFSQPIDLSATSSLPPPLYFTSDVRAVVDPSNLMDLKPLLEAADPGVRRTFVYGDQNAEDSAHALHVADIPHLEMVAMPKVGHSTVEHLVADDGLVSLFAKLISD